MKKVLCGTVICFLTYFPVNAQTVYITKTGEKYHKVTCHYLRYSRYPIFLQDAKDKAYEACKICKPPTEVTEKRPTIDSTQIIEPSKRHKIAVSRQCSATAKSTGRRCRRMTKNASGKCWQHE